MDKLDAIERDLLTMVESIRRHKKTLQEEKLLPAAIPTDLVVKELDSLYSPRRTGAELFLDRIKQLSVIVEWTGEIDELRRVIQTYLDIQLFHKHNYIQVKDYIITSCEALKTALDKWKYKQVAVAHSYIRIFLTDE